MWKIIATIRRRTTISCPIRRRRSRRIPNYDAYAGMPPAEPAGPRSATQVEASRAECSRCHVGIDRRGTLCQIQPLPHPEGAGCGRLRAAIYPRGRRHDLALGGCHLAVPAERLPPAQPLRRRPRLADRLRCPGGPLLPGRGRAWRVRTQRRDRPRLAPQPALSDGSDPPVLQRSAFSRRAGAGGPDGRVGAGRAQQPPI